MDDKEWKQLKHQIIKNDTIELTPVTINELDFLCKEETDAELWKYEEYVETDKERILKKFSDRIENGNFFDFIVRRNSDHEPVGVVYIWKYDAHRGSWEIGYVILPEYQGFGYCVNSVKLLLHFAFEELKAHKVVGMCNSENLSSAAVMEKAGMSKQGVFREEYLCQGRWVDQFFYSILESTEKVNY